LPQAKESSLGAGGTSPSNGERLAPLQRCNPEDGESRNRCCRNLGPQAGKLLRSLVQQRLAVVGLANANAGRIKTTPYEELARVDDTLAGGSKNAPG
jgi:hypothetical protein